MKNYCFKSVFSRYKETLLLKLIMTHSKLANYTFVSRIETFIFSLWSFQRLETLRFPTALSYKLRRPPLNSCRNLKVFWGPCKGRNLPESVRWNLWQVLVWLSWPWETSLDIQSETPFEEFHYSHFGGTYVGNWTDLFCKKIILDLVVSGGDEGNCREKKIMFQWIINSSFVNGVLYLLKLTSQTVPCYYVIIMQSLIELLTGHSDQGIDPRRRYNNCKYLCTQHRSTSIHKANTNSHKRGNQQ